MDSFQDWIHRLEVGGGMRFVRIGVVGLVLLFMFFGYNWRAFRNMENPEAMDAAQLARNFAEGKGWTTSVIRPFSMYLLKERSIAKYGIMPIEVGRTNDIYCLKQPHPDISNPPVYPLLLAGVMKILPFDYEISEKPRVFWTRGGSFWRHQPDFLIGAFNQLLLFALVGSVYLLARRYFDRTVALVSALLLLGTDLLWRYALSGLSTILLMLILMGVVWCLALLEEETREPRFGAGGIYLLTALAGLLVGVGCLTRYSFCMMIIPVLIFVLVNATEKRFAYGGIALLSFLLVVSPWLWRNYEASGAIFGTASFAVQEGTIFQEDRLERSLDPQIKATPPQVYWQKLLGHSRQMLQNDVPRLGGTWVTAFFVVGLMVGFRHPTLRRIRYFTVGSFVLLFVVQAVTRTRSINDAPEVNPENLLILLLPLMIVFGVSMFFMLLEQIHFPMRQLRLATVGVFAVAACFPLLMSFLPPKTVAVAWPPYYPPSIQGVCNWMKPNELIMSDVPWAVAWYGRRTSLLLTLNAQNDFLTINDYHRAINAVYLTPLTLDRKLGSQCLSPGADGWGLFAFSIFAKGQVPAYFPLQKVGPVPYAVPMLQMFLTDWERWPKNSK